jgi:Ca2+-binding EF-hand superfamily protein
MQLKSLEKEVWDKFSLDDQISFDQAKPAVRYIIARLRGDLERQFTDKKFRVLFREIDVNNNGKIERAELSMLVKKLA